MLALGLLVVLPGSTAALRLPSSSSPLLRPTARRSRHLDHPRARQQEEVVVTARLNEERVEQLFAWLSCAFAGDGRYNNLMLAFAAIFGEHADDSPYAILVAEALSRRPPEDAATGEPFSLRERERGSLGAMGAGQWTGQWRTRPHALLDVRDFDSVEEWVKALPRGARRTLAKAEAQNFTVRALPIRGNAPAPHSTLAQYERRAPLELSHTPAAACRLCAHRRGWPVPLTTLHTAASSAWSRTRSACCPTARTTSSMRSARRSAATATASRRVRFNSRPSRRPSPLSDYCTSLPIIVPQEARSGSTAMRKAA